MTDAFHSFEAGNLVVTALSDGWLDAPGSVLLDPGTGARPEEPGLRIPVNCFLVRGGGQTVLIDTGGGPLAPTCGRMLASLQAAGVSPDEVDLVLLTHLHSDHAGMLSTADGAVFPTADLGIPAAEAAFWLDEASERMAPEPMRPYFAAARAAVAPYAERTRLLDAGPVTEGIELVPLPGHTPGHSGFRVGSGADALLIWGDIMHVPAVQAPVPETGVIWDADGAGAIATRQAALAQSAAGGTPVAGSHMEFPPFVRVEAEGSGYRLVPLASGR